MPHWEKIISFQTLVCDPDLRLVQPWCVISDPELLQVTIDLEILRASHSGSGPNWINLTFGQSEEIEVSHRYAQSQSRQSSNIWPQKTCHHECGRFQKEHQSSCQPELVSDIQNVLAESQTTNIAAARQEHSHYSRQQLGHRGSQPWSLQSPELSTCDTIN